MNTRTLTKCVDELKKDTPNIQYVLGMLETIIEMSSGVAGLSPLNIPINVAQTKTNTIIEETDEFADNPFAKVGPIGNLTVS